MNAPIVQSVADLSPNTSVESPDQVVIKEAVEVTVEEATDETWQDYRDCADYCYYGERCRRYQHRQF